MPDPVINVDSETVIDLPPAGGSASFEYQIDNPVEGGQFKAEPEDTWMSSFTCEDGKVNFNVEANKEEEARTSSITLVYTYSGDKTVEATVTQPWKTVQHISYSTSMPPRARQMRRILCLQQEPTQCPKPRPI